MRPLPQIIRNCHTLADLRGALRSGVELTDQQWAELPVFGGEEPGSTIGVWSWDADNLLVGDSREGLRIIPRAGQGL